MILTELTLHNFRAFQDETFYFSKRVTVIAGINGRGKSGILDAVALLLSRLLPQVSPAVGGYKYLRAQDIHHGKTELNISLTALFGELPIEFSIDYKNTTKQRSSKLVAAVRQAIQAVSGTTAAPVAVYYTTDRAAYRLPKSLLTGLPQDQAAAYHGALFNRQIDFRDFISRFRTWLKSVENREDVSGKNQRTITMIEHVIGIFLPGFANLRIEDHPLRLIVSKGGEALDLTQISDGERAMLAMMIDLCRRLALANPGLDDPLQGEGVVLIDEIELHLHPRWQREIVEKLRTTFPHIQFILTTHSPFVVQTLRDGELRLLSPDLTVNELEDPGAYANQGLEAVTTKVMGIDDPNVVPRYRRMLDAARDYYQLLETATPDDEQQLEALRVRLDELVAPFADEPAYLAFLEVQRVAAFEEGQIEIGEINEAD